ncbi:hypothetical protein AAFO92_01500 [Roseovarius sp. CAU 1744]|uniref:hypothetical protein n=1 Tax=Roseovarius sp. CAU 1744 TaxID=3140368 RepID=UPI00325BECAB
MKTLVLALTLSLSASMSMAFGSFISSTTPTLNFPKDKSTAETVTKEKTMVAN